MQIEGAHVLLTGASGGIGAAVARAIARAGGRLTLVGRRQRPLEHLAEGLEGAHEVLAADIGQASERERIRSHCESQGLDVLVNAAGTMDFDLFERQAEDSIERMLNTNLLAPMLLCRAVLPVLERRETAAIVNVGSIFGSIGHPGFAAYSASKFGLRGFSEALQRELHDTGIRVSYLAPRATRTAMNTEPVVALNAELGNAMDDPEVVADEVIGVLRSHHRQRYMGRPERFFVRLNQLFPGIVHGALARKLPIIRKHAGQPTQESPT